MAIHIKASHKGLLHKDLGVKEGKPISTKKLHAAEKHASPAEEKRIVFAENAKQWNNSAGASHIGAGHPKMHTSKHH